ncbi:hypothetical protein FSZ31_12405 [Sphingorhabdus soli]|uniref:Circumsporozoite protein n=2 Tax=Flavisphingopyxis soli TaxID=2601267 RepID=A0A5C6U7L6_9SPHN|nr:hypothetical protein FSZ31_12405 [Sphingorhabdus soli]
MRKFFTVAMVATAALGLAACSEKTQDNAAETADSMGNDVANAADATGEAIDNTGEAIANEGTAVEAAAQDESMNEAAAD